MTRMIRGIDKRHVVRTAGGAKDQWFTDPTFAAFVARWGGIKPAHYVLDLGAGIGALTRAAIGCGAVVTALEVDRRHEKKLRANVGDRARVIIADAFDPHLIARIPEASLRCGPGLFDFVLTNPPWSGENEPRFIRRGLDLAPRVIAIVSEDAMSGVAKDALWRSMRVTDELKVPGRLSYSLDGSTGQENCMAVVAELRGAPRPLGCVDIVRRSYYTPPRRA